jgi:hypothetical protein
VTSEQWVIFIGLAQLVIFTLQLFVFRDQAQKLAQTVKAAAEQSEDMKESIKASKRAADAMEKSAKAATIASENVVVVTERTGQQIRAYLCVNIWTGVYQERAKGLRFEAKPILINTGQTPAYNVSYKAKADIFPFPLPDNFTLPPLDSPGFSAGLLGPHQNFILNAVVNKDYDDAEVENIKRGKGQRVYIWGTVNYEDVFGEKKYTNFFQSIVWTPTKEGEGVIGNYLSQHSDAN